MTKTWPSAFLIDLDNTLHDFNAAAHLAHRAIIAKVAEESGLPADGLLQRYKAILELEPDSRITTSSEARLWRLRELLKERPETAKIDASKLADLLAQLQLGATTPIEGAIESVRALQHDAPVMIVTEGYEDMQRAVLHRLGLEDCGIDLLATRAHGTVKRNGSAYKLAAKLLEAAPEDLLVIGDNWSWDIAAAGQCGMWQVWANATSDPTSPRPPRHLGRIASIAHAPALLPQWRRMVQDHAIL